MNVHLERITRDNWQQVIALDIADDQRGFIQEPSLLHVVAESQFYPDYTPHASYVDDAVVGFVTYGRPPEAPTVWWIPLLIVDHRHQGRGYGRAAMQIVIRRIQENAPECRAVGLSYHPANTRAARLYAQLGFELAGGTYEKREVIAWLRLGPPGAPG